MDDVFNALVVLLLTLVAVTDCERAAIDGPFMQCAVRTTEILP